ncbi:protein-ADP-ribose hydrolase [Thermophilibacter sp.]
MTREELVKRCVELLLDDMPEYRAQAAAFPRGDAVARRRLLRSLMNVRVPGRPLPDAYWAAQDALLSAERAERGVVDVADLPPTAADQRLVVWQGDITRLAADAVVNAANSALLGCFVPCHGCIDNAIHSAAGLRLRDECAALMRAQGHEEPAGHAKITRGYNLPAAHVIHTVGPIVCGPEPTARDRADLASCYRSCLELADSRGLRTIAFCCISTGEFRFPRREAARIAVREVRAFLDERAGVTSVSRVVFDVFTDEDLAIYRELLGEDER